nr:spore coat protein [Clostridia bacterium]
MTSDYNSFANESATPEVVSKVMEILRDEHDIQRDMWCEMNSRGWYPTEPADDNKLNGVKNKFSTMA